MYFKCQKYTELLKLLIFHLYAVVSDKFNTTESGRHRSQII